jgi:shikimate kinase
MMGTGKTTVGVVVADLIGRPFVDIDSLVMERTGKTIPELFDEGEPVFRSWERRIIAEMVEARPSVISTGGGAVMLQANVDVMGRTGRLVLLTAPTETIIRRVSSDPSRPLGGDRAAIEALAAIRRETYEAVADCVVDTTSRDVHEIAEEVAACATIK